MTFALIALSLLVLVLVVLWRQSVRYGARLLATVQAAAQTSSRRQAEIDRLVAALCCASDGLIVLDEHGGIVATNPAAIELASLPAQELRGRRLEDLLAWPALHRALQACRADGEPQAFELGGEAGAEVEGGRVLAVRVHALAGLGSVVGIDDQSRLKRLESLRRDFVANVSHELKTPLAAIQGFVETLQDDPDMPLPTRVRFLDRIARQSERLATLVGDLLTLSRLDEELGSARELEPVDLVAVLRDTLRDLQPLADKRQQVLAAQLPATSIWVRAEREALRQVAGNLIDNAIKYTPPGGRVTLSTRHGGERVRCEVVDTGIGLSVADQERVFERFYRVDRARSRDLGGTGLGLSIVKNTVKTLGGEVGVRSELGHGSTFWVELPCEAAPPSE
ncbi:MAG: ATP-binding protein [Planctomycetes bacterium]|jgi:two-component system phosphate regulon sensor histidine kinase PhoR|nr:ATP-binding protein [Planctomycetota bacterium]